MTAPSYTTLAKLKTITNTPLTDTSRDEFYSDVVTDCSRLIDTWTRNQFYPTTETRYFDYQEPFRLMLDKRLVSVTAFTNGDGLTVQVDTAATKSINTEALLYPLNPKYPCYDRIELLRNVGRVLYFTNTPQAALSVSGVWGYPTVPDEIVEATNRLISYVAHELDLGGVVREESDTYRDFYVNFMEGLKTPPSAVVPIVDRFKFVRLANAMPTNEVIFWSN